MAIIKCDEGLPPGDGTSDDDSGTGDGVAAESYVEQNKVSLGKTLLAVESGFFIEDTINQVVLSKVDERYLETRPQDISDTLRADCNRYWTLDENGNMKYMNVDIGETLSENVNIEFPAPPFWMARYTNRTTEVGTTDLGLPIIEEEYVITEWNLVAAQGPTPVGESAVWNVFIEGGEADNGTETFSRPSPLIPVGETFTDHAFTMNTPFSKKELEMFANIEGDIYVADAESDYDFFVKAYEEGIASTNVPENALPHLYTEVQRGESGDENTDKDELKAGYFREWINTVLSNQDKMNDIAEDYENVAILDSVVGEENILDSENKSTSAFEILMAYTNRENLFPMNINIEVGVDKETPSDLMLQAEDVGMVDDIVKMLMGDGDVVPALKPDSDTADGESQGGESEPVPIAEEEEFEWTQWKSKIKYDFGKLWPSGNILLDASYHDSDKLLKELKGWNRAKNAYNYTWPKYVGNELQSATLSPLWEQIEKYIDDNSGGFGEETVDEAFYYSPTDPNAAESGGTNAMKVVVEVKEHKGIVKLWCYFWEEV
jgi:hypothetical protein